MNNLEEQKETIDVSTSDVVDGHNFKAKVKKHMALHKVERFISDFELIIIAALYVLLSLLVKGPIGHYHLNGWSFWWILFLVLPLGPQVFKVVKNKNFNSFPIAVVVLVIYLNIGLLYGKWHPFWALFFIIPFYHYLMFKINVHRFKKIHNL